MTQRQVDLFFKRQFKHAATDRDKKKEISITLSNSKQINVYYSKSFKEFVISFNLGSKKFVINRKNWLYFRKFLNDIDQTILNQ